MSASSLSASFSSSSGSSASIYEDHSTGPMYQVIQKKIVDTLQPTHLEIINESRSHNVPKDSETHFKLIIVSDEFKGQTPLKKHRMVRVHCRISMHVVNVGVYV